jgi:chromosome segregation ATPase
MISDERMEALRSLHEPISHEEVLALLAEMRRLTEEREALAKRLEEVQAACNRNANEVVTALAERDAAREALREAQAVIENARFWADEFSDDSLEYTVFALYAYVVHWHNAADALAGGHGKALPLYPPPTPEKLRADLAEDRRRALGGEEGAGTP